MEALEAVSKRKCIMINKVKLVTWGAQGLINVNRIRVSQSLRNPKVYRWKAYTPSTRFSFDEHVVNHILLEYG